MSGAPNENHTYFILLGELLGTDEEGIRKNGSLELGSHAVIQKALEAYQ